MHVYARKIYHFLSMYIDGERESKKYTRIHMQWCCWRLYVSFWPFLTHIYTIHFVKFSCTHIPDETHRRMREKRVKIFASLLRASRFSNKYSNDGREEKYKKKHNRMENSFALSLSKILPILRWFWWKRLFWCCVYVELWAKGGWCVCVHRTIILNFW